MLKPDPLTSSPNEAAAIDDINAIYLWVVAQRPLTKQYPAALPLIEKFESWYGSLEQKFDEEHSILFQYIGVADVNEAKRQRIEIMKATGQAIPSDWPVPQGPPGIPPPPYNPLRELGNVVVTTAALLAVGAFFLSRSRR
jgi:hypothetical protein